MSNIYINEPPTCGKVLLKTTFGDLDIELWSKECPLASRNFIQLCMENYYEGTIFHRVIKNFIAQGGDPSGTGLGGESIYGKPFKDEFHQRLKFNRHGLVAMANSGSNDNGSQFFITLGPTPDLQNKHTIFGKVSGDTKYNILKLNDLQTDDNDRPIQPPKIKKSIILANPYTDIVPRLSNKQVEEKRLQEAKDVSQKTLSTKSFNLLSFGDEAYEDEEENTQIVSTVFTKFGKSSHDLTNDPLLLKELAIPTTAPHDTDINDNLVRGKTNNAKLDESKIGNFKQKLLTITDRVNGENNDDVLISSESRFENLTKYPPGINHNVSSDSLEKISTKEGYITESSKNALTEYVESNKIYKDRKKLMPKKGPKREQQTLTLLSTFRQKLEQERSSMLRNAKFAKSSNLLTYNSENDIDIASYPDHNLDYMESDENVDIKPKNNTLTKREKFARVQESLKNPEHLTEQYPELRLWEDKGYEELAEEQIRKHDGDIPDPSLKDIMTHKFVCSDVSDLSDEEDNYPVHKVKHKKEKKTLDEESLHEASPSRKSVDELSGDEDYYILKKTKKDACSVQPHEYYDIYDPRNPINVRRRQGETADSRPHTKRTGDKTDGTVPYDIYNQNYDQNEPLPQDIVEKQQKTAVGGSKNTFFGKKNDDYVGTKKYEGPTTNHAQNMKDFLKSRSTFYKKS